ncbi:MAG: chromosome segregation ATPase [Oceanicoccus sp.]|jgi:chromosome segregation ATPase
MTTELFIILELCLLLVAIIVISVMIWRGQSKHIDELTEINQALMSQLNDTHTVLDETQSIQEAMTNEFEDLGDAVDIQVNNTIDFANDSINDMTNLVADHMKLLKDTDYYLSQGKPDIESARKTINSLKDLLSGTEKNIIKSKDKLAKAEDNINKLKEKMRELSKQLKTFDSLEVSESRLKRDKIRLTEHIEKLKSKHESQKVTEKNLKNELKTSFRASEVQAMRDELKQTENKLQQALVEKSFIEAHFLELTTFADPKELDNELRRVKREMRQLEKGILDMSNDFDKPN